VLDALIRPALLIALVTAAAGPWCAITVLRPALRDASLLPEQAAGVWRRLLGVSSVAAWVALCLGPPELYMQMVAVSGGSILSGVGLSDVWRFLSRTGAGRVWVGRMLLLGALLPVLMIFRRRAGSGTSVTSGVGLGWWLGLVLAGGALASRALASHASALASGSPTAIAANALHILAGASWIGLLIHFRALLPQLRRLETETARPVLTSVVNRITPVSLAGAAVLVCTGLYSATRHLDSAWAMIASPYGLTVLAKLLLLVPVLAAGSLNVLVIRPALNAGRPPKGASDGARGELCRRLMSLVEIEVAAGAAILAMAAVLAGVPPPASDPWGTVGPARMAELVTPRPPPLSSPGIGPGPWPAIEQTADDYAYSVFNHAWAGAALIVIALSAFLEKAVGHRVGWIRAWPVLFVVLAVFLFVRNDPEAWPFGPVGFMDSMQIPEMVQHRFTVLLLVALGCVEGLGRWGTVERSRWAYIFPSLCLVGGLMLLSHSHDLGISADDTQTYIYVQHAVMGVFALSAGLCRWFELRQSEEWRWIGRLWPLFVFLLGVQMFLFYKEL
jgi:putative copper resistance protein D